MPHQTNILNKNVKKSKTNTQIYIYENIEKDFAVESTESVVPNGREKLPELFFFISFKSRLTFSLSFILHIFDWVTIIDHVVKKKSSQNVEHNFEGKWRGLHAMGGKFNCGGIYLYFYFIFICFLTPLNPTDWRKTKWK